MTMPGPTLAAPAETPRLTTPGAFLVAQLGARMHFAVARSLHHADRLSLLLTDFCATRGAFRWLNVWPERTRPALLRRLLNRAPQGVPASKVRANWRLGLSYARRFANTRSEAERVRLFLDVGKRFGDWAAAQDWAGAAGVFVYNTAGLEVIREAKRRGLTAIMEQTIAPYEMEHRLMADERRRFGRWELDPGETPEFAEYAARERDEWDRADRVLCGSPFVRDAVTACGGPAEKCVVIPYGVDGGYRLPDRAPHGGPMRVLTVGAVGLRKGAPYAIEAARRLRGRAEFRWVGPFKMARDARAELGPDVQFTGPVPRGDVVGHYAWADVFLLPSLCEGSATATYEALTAGLPVVCTPNTGSVVRDGVEGYIVPARDTDFMVARLAALAADAGLRRSMAEAARSRAAEFGYESYARGLLAALEAGERG